MLHSDSIDIAWKEQAHVFPRTLRCSYDASPAASKRSPRIRLALKSGESGLQLFCLDHPTDSTDRNWLGTVVQPFSSGITVDHPRSMGQKLAMMVNRSDPSEDPPSEGLPDDTKTEPMGPMVKLHGWLNQQNGIFEWVCNGNITPVYCQEYECIWKCSWKSNLILQKVMFPTIWWLFWGIPPFSEWWW